MNERNDEMKELETLERALRAVHAEADPAVLKRALRRLEAPVAPAHAIAAWLLRPAAAWSAAALLAVSVLVSYGMLRSTESVLAPTQVVDSLLEDDASFDLLPEDEGTTPDTGAVS